MNKTENLIFISKFSNIFEFSFMDDFTTVELAKEEYGINSSELNFDDDFYCFSEKKTYSTEELYRKFDIQVIEDTDNQR